MKRDTIDPATYLPISAINILGGKREGKEDTLVGAKNQKMHVNVIKIGLILTHLKLLGKNWGTLGE